MPDPDPTLDDRLEEAGAAWADAASTELRETLDLHVDSDGHRKLLDQLGEAYRQGAAEARRLADGANTQPAAVDVTECPDCGQKGRYDGRVLIGGRGVYACPAGHRWQDGDEVPSAKGYAALEVKESRRA